MLRLFIRDVPILANRQPRLQPAVPNDISQTITTPPFYRLKLPFSVVARLDPVIYLKE